MLGGRTIEQLATLNIAKIVRFLAVKKEYKFVLNWSSIPVPIFFFFKEYRYPVQLLCCLQVIHIL